MSRHGTAADVPLMPAAGGSAPQGEGATIVRRPVFHVFEEFYRRALRAEPRPARSSRPAVRPT